MNGHVIFLKYFSKGNLHLFRPIVQKGGRMVQPCGGEVVTLISNVFRKGMALRYSHQLPPTKIGKN